MRARGRARPLAPGPGADPPRGRQAADGGHGSRRHGAADARRVHAGRGAGVPGDRQEPGARRALHDDLPYGGDLHQRHPGAWPRRHRAGRVDAGDGGQGRLLPAVRRHLGRADPDRRQGRRHVRGHGRADRADLRGHPPRGHLGPRVLRDRAAADRGAATACDARRRPRDRRGDDRGRDRGLSRGGRRTGLDDGRPARSWRGRLRNRLADGRRRRREGDRLRSARGLSRARARARDRDLLDGGGHGDGPR